MQVFGRESGAVSDEVRVRLGLLGVVINLSDAGHRYPSITISRPSTYQDGDYEPEIGLVADYGGPSDAKAGDHGVLGVGRFI